MSESPAATLRQAGPAVLTRELEAGELEVFLPWQGLRTVASGVLARDIRAVMAGEQATARLRAIATTMPWLEELTRLTDAAAPLTYERALNLDTPHLLFIEVTGNCNERCLHCYAEAGPTVRDSLREEQVLGLCRDAATLGFRKVQFTGGDPLIAPYLARAVELATSLGLSVEIYTNGLLLTDKRLASLAPFGPSFAFSLYSHRDSVHDAITRTPGSLQRTLAAIRRTLAAGLGTRVGMVAMKENHDHLDETVALLHEMGVSHLNVTPSFDVGRGEQYLGSLPQNVSQHHDGVEGKADSRPFRGGKLCVTYTGDVVPCVFNRRQVIGTVTKDRGLVQVLRETRPRSLESNLDVFMRDACTQLQCGDCRMTAAALELLAQEST